MAETISCPHCSAKLAVPDTIPVGSTVKCPSCSTAFSVPPLGGSAIREGEPAPQPPPSAPPRDDQPSTTGYYHVEFGDYFNQASMHYMSVFGPMVGYGFILIAIYLAQGCVGCIPIVGGCFSFLFNLLLNFALLAGFPLVCLRQMRGRAWSFGDLFGGFRYWVQLFVVNVLSTLLGLVCLGPAYALIFAGQLMMPSAGRSGNPFLPPEHQRPQAGFEQDPTLGLTLLLVGFGLLLIGFLPMIYFSVRCFLFATFFVIDRNCSPIDAIKANWTLTRGHFWGWFGVAFVLGIILFAAALPCFLGLPFALPYVFLVLTAGYLRATGARMVAPS